MCFKWTLIHFRCVQTIYDAYDANNQKLKQKLQQEIAWVYGAPMAVPPVPVTFVTAVVSASAPVSTMSSNNENSTSAPAQVSEAGLSAAADIVQNIESPLNIDVTPPGSPLSLEMAVLTPVDIYKNINRKQILTTPPPPSTPEPAEPAEPRPSTSAIPVEVVPTPTFLPSNCEVTVNPAPTKNFCDSLQIEEEEDNDEEECKIIEAPPPSKKSRLMSLKNEVSLIAARLYQVGEELDEIQNQL